MGGTNVSAELRWLPLEVACFFSRSRNFPSLEISSSFFLFKLAGPVIASPAQKITCFIMFAYISGELFLVRLIGELSAKYCCNGKATQQKFSVSIWRKLTSLKEYMAVVGHCVLGEDLGLQQLYAAETIQN